MSNEPRYTVLGTSIYDGALFLAACNDNDSARALCDLLNAGEQARSLAAAVATFESAKGVYSLAGWANGWRVENRTVYASGRHLVDVLIALAIAIKEENGGTP